MNADEDKTTKSIRFPNKLIKKIEEEGDKNNRNFSNQVIQIITKYFEMKRED